MSDDWVPPRDARLANVRFDVEWLTGEQGSPAERASYGSLSIRAGDQVLTNVQDTIARTTRSSIRVSLNQVALWFAHNWWRLRWEPAMTHVSLSWRMAHEMAAIGGGFAWPSLSMTSDGDEILVEMRASEHEHTIAYLRDHFVVWRATDFEYEVDRFVEQVLARQHDMRAVDPDLRDTWQAVCEERADTELSAFRKREAILGLDPSEHDSESLQRLFDEGMWLGPGALDEALAGQNEKDAGDMFSELKSLRGTQPIRWSFSKVLEAVNAWTPPSNLQLPWQRGASLAKHLRAHWGIGEEPISDDFFGDMLGENIHADMKDAPIYGAFVDDAHLQPLLRHTHYVQNRRFDVARLIADAAVANAGDKMYTMTKMKTARQKFQRAAAQELLCPVDALAKRVNIDDPDDEQLAEAAKHFDVSELLVRTALVNRGRLSRDYLA